MATGVQPRDDDHQFTKIDLENIQDALKQKKFRDLLSDYVEEIRDPANQALYQKEMTQLEKERGYDVTFINPKGGYVIKTSVAGDRKAFINICSNDNVAKPSCQTQIVDGKKGMNWQVPYSLIPPREDYGKNREKCVIYDVVFHPDTLRMASKNKQFRELVNKTAFNALQKTYDVHLDCNNFKFPKSQYKGMMTPAVIRKEDPNYQPPTEEEMEELTPELMEKLYPQHIYENSQRTGNNDILNEPTDRHSKHKNSEPVSKATEKPKESYKRNKKIHRSKEEFFHSTDNGYTVPKYVIKQQKDVDLQDFTYHKDCKKYTAIPNQIVVEIYLPLLSSTKDCTLDVQERKLSLVSETPAKYKLNLSLPYPVNDQCGNAKFDKTKRKLIVTLPVIRKNMSNESHHLLRADSGVESEYNSHSDEDKENLIEEISSTPAPPIETQVEQVVHTKKEIFLDPSLGYVFPKYTHNTLDGTLAITFHVKNTEPDSVKVKEEHSKVYIKFTTIGAGFVPVHYAAVVIFEEGVQFANVSGEAWNNNVILQLDISGEMPKIIQIGLDENSLSDVELNMLPVAKSSIETSIISEEKEQEVAPPPTVEVTSSGTETQIHVSSNDSDDHEDDSKSSDERGIVWTQTDTSGSRAKSILRKSMGRSYSESSVGDVASSMDYISSDCIPEESSFKKTVRFNQVIAKQVYRYNSSIEGQKKKNQRKKSKKRNQERSKSESEAEDEHISNKEKATKTKSALKQRRDSGLADTSDYDNDSKSPPATPDTRNDNQMFSPTKTSKTKIVQDMLAINKESEPVIWEAENQEATKQDKSQPLTCDNIEHKTDLYNPDKLNKGQYLEVKFKNDLIFDLDM